MQPRRDQYVKMPNQAYGQYLSRAQLTDQQNFRYFSEFNKLYYTAFCIKTQMKDLQKVGSQLKNKVQSFQKNFEDFKKINHNVIQRIQSERPKRFRRTNDMISKPYVCSEPKCDKIYASQGSLQQHIKLKHEKSQNLLSLKVEQQSQSDQSYSCNQNSMQSISIKDQQKSKSRVENK